MSLASIGTQITNYTNMKRVQNRLDECFVTQAKKTAADSFEIKGYKSLPLNPSCEYGPTSLVPFSVLNPPVEENPRVVVSYSPSSGLHTKINGPIVKTEDGKEIQTVFTVRQTKGFEPNISAMFEENLTNESYSAIEKFYKSIQNAIKKGFLPTMKDIK